MGLRHKRHIRRPGWPEAVTLALGLALVAFTVLWAGARDQGVHLCASGAVTACKIQDTHLNAPPSEKRITLGYEYTVAGRTFAGTWVGLWPTGHSPNALPGSRIDALKVKGHPLTVYYNPANPAKSFLHEPEAGTSLVYAILALLCGGGLLVYILAVYPTLRR